MTKTQTKQKIFTDEDLLELIRKSFFLERKFKEQYEGMLTRGIFADEQKEHLHKILIKEKEGLKCILQNPKFEELKEKVSPISKEEIWEECKKTLVKKVNEEEITEEEVKALIPAVRQILNNSEDLREAIASISDRYEPLKSVKQKFELQENAKLEDVVQRFIGLIMDEKGIEEFELVRKEMQNVETEEYIAMLMEKYPELFNKAANGTQ
jgi:hypothetical protein